MRGYTIDRNEVRDKKEREKEINSSTNDE